LSNGSIWDWLDRAKVYDLGQPLEPNIPVSPNHPGFRLALMRRHGDMVRADGGSAANEMFVMGGHVGTHMDALAHVSHNGKLFGGIDACENQVGGRFKQLGIDTVKPVVCRGILLDIAGLKGVTTLAPGTGISADDLRQAAECEGIAPRQGDAVLVRSGWSANWTNPLVYIGLEAGVPGVDPSGAELIASWGARVTGHDSVAYEQIHPGAGHSLLPVHRILLVENGIHIIENLNLDELARDQVYEFLFTVSPLKIVGATGSPVRPVAVVTP
jgi:kynurenine formamidase